MDGRNPNAIAERQVLGPLFSGIFGGGDDDPTSTTSGPTGGIASILSPLLPRPTSTSSGTSSSTSSRSSSIASSSSSSSSLSKSLTTSSSILSTGNSSPTSSPSLTSSTSSIPLSTSVSVFETTSGGAVVTVTSFEAVPAATQSSSSAPQKTFLQNKPLSGFVFALAGVVGLVIIIVIATFALRRRRRSRLLNDAISFDPSVVDGGRYDDEMERADLTEKRRMSLSSSGHGHVGGSASGGSTAHLTNYPQSGYPGPILPTAYGQHSYYDQGQGRQGYEQQGYGQQGARYNPAEYPAYAPAPPRSPNPIYDPAHAYGGPSAPQLNQTGSTQPSSNARLNTSLSIIPTRSPLLTSPYSPLASPTQPNTNIGKHAHTRSGDLGPSMTSVPVAPLLPATFGSTERSERESIEDTQFLGRTLKIANE